MPRQAIDYSKTIIYKIVCDDLPGYIYIGSTTNFRGRKATHKCYSKTKEIKLYEIIRANGGWENWKMIEIEEFACENGRQAEKREQYYMDLFKSNLNTYKSFFDGTSKEYIKQYKLEHKEELNEKSKQYYLEHKEEQAKHYLKHKEELSQKVTCECGAIVSKQSLTRHKKRRIHLDFISSI